MDLGGWRERWKEMGSGGERWGKEERDVERKREKGGGMRWVEEERDGERRGWGEEERDGERMKEIGKRKREMGQGGTRWRVKERDGKGGEK